MIHTELLMTETDTPAHTPLSDTLDRLETKLDGIRRQLNWLAVGAAAVWLFALVGLFRG